MRRPIYLLTGFLLICNRISRTENVLYTEALGDVDEKVNTPRKTEYVMSITGVSWISQSVFHKYCS